MAKLKDKSPLKKAVTEPELRRMLKDAYGDAMAPWAKEQEVTPQSVSAFMRKVQPAGLKIPAIFNLVPITVFVPKGHKLEFEYPKRNASTPKAEVPAITKQAKKSLKEVEKAEKGANKKKKKKKV